RQGVCQQVPVLSPDGKLLATFSTGQTIQVYELATGKLVRRLSLPLGANFGVEIAFSPDGQLLAATNGAPAVFLWQLASGKELSQLHALEAPLVKVLFAPHGRTVATITENGALHIREVGSGKTVCSCRHPADLKPGPILELLAEIVRITELSLPFLLS